MTEQLERLKLLEKRHNELSQTKEVKTYWEITNEIMKIRCEIAFEEYEKSEFGRRMKWLSELPTRHPEYLHKLICYIEDGDLWKVIASGRDDFETIEDLHKYQEINGHCDKPVTFEWIG